MNSMAAMRLRCGSIRDRTGTLSATMGSQSVNAAVMGRERGRKDGLLMWQVRMRMWQVRTRSFQKKQSIRVGTVGTQNDHKEAARSLRAREKKLRTYCGDLRRHMNKSARLANI